MITFLLELAAKYGLGWLIGWFRPSRDKDIANANKVQNDVASESDAVVADKLQKWTR